MVCIIGYIAPAFLYPVVCVCWILKNRDKVAVPRGLCYVRLTDCPGILFAGRFFPADFFVTHKTLRVKIEGQSFKKAIIQVREVSVIIYSLDVTLGVI